MGKMVSLGRILECFSLPSPAGSCSCFCTSSGDDQAEGFGQDMESKPLIPSDNKQMMRLKDLIGGTHQTLAFQLKPKMVTLKVAMHCHGCAKRVEKHISKMDGVTSYKIDLENKMVVVIGDILPFEVLESVSKVKYAELWNA
ncbi:hypothetical protein BT93_C0634 [Corymbia citriodora subsp. variegata]|nr:hypothetical protein BT93_C0634 [Corymbia citriodora subsp. variegata]